MKLDKDGSGSIDKEEFLAIPQIATNPLASRLIAIMDEDGGGDVDFKEFIAGLSAFSNKGNKVEKLRCKILIFTLFDCLPGVCGCRIILSIARLCYIYI